MARREKMTLYDLYNLTAAARGHWVVAGTPARIADVFEEWFTGGLADGFIIMPAYFPGAFDDFVDKVVPELQRRGLFRKDLLGTDAARPPGPCRTVGLIAATHYRASVAGLTIRDVDGAECGDFGEAVPPHAAK
jgi:hypothetical protein